MGSQVVAQYCNIFRSSRENWLMDDGLPLTNFSKGRTVSVKQEIREKPPGVKPLLFIGRQLATLFTIIVFRSTSHA